MGMMNSRHIEGSVYFTENVYGSGIQFCGRARSNQKQLRKDKFFKCFSEGKDEFTRFESFDNLAVILNVGRVGIKTSIDRMARRRV